VSNEEQRISDPQRGRPGGAVDRPDVSGPPGAARPGAGPARNRPAPDPAQERPPLNPARKRPLFLQALTPNVLLLGVVSFFADVSSEMLYPLIPLFLTITLGPRPLWWG